MTNPKYFINIVYVPVQPAGQQLAFFNGATHSVPKYSPAYFVATMPEVSIAATGSSYTESLSNLLALVGPTSSVIDNGHDPINNF